MATYTTSIYICGDDMVDFHLYEDLLLLMVAPSWAESDDRLWAISVDWTMRNPIHTYIILKPKLEHRGYTLHHIASHYITLLQIVSHCITLHHIASHCITLRPITSHCITLRHSESHCFTLHRIAAYCITCTASNCITLHHIASQYIPLHHSASLYITISHYITWHHITKPDIVFRE